MQIKWSTVETLDHEPSTAIQNEGGDTHKKKLKSAKKEAYYPANFSITILFLPERRMTILSPLFQSNS